MMRGDELENYNVVEFFTNTYERKINEKMRMSFEEDEDKSIKMSQSGVGRPQHQHVQYRRAHPKWGKFERVIRPQDPNNLPHFVGRQSWI
jgi:hypothetical protein